MKAKDILLDSFKFLKDNNISEAKLNSEYIISSVLQIERKDLFFYLDRIISESELKKINRLLKLKIKGYPLSWIIGNHQFLDINLKIGYGVFVPRPETEELAELAFKESKNFKNPQILDFCSGSGCISLYIAKKNDLAKLYSIDSSKRAISCLKENIKKLGLKNIRYILSSKIDAFGSKYDIIVSNPPYVPDNIIANLDIEVRHEPLKALRGGFDGLNIIRYIEKKSRQIIKRKGVILIEFGDKQSDRVAEIFKKWSQVEILKDLQNKNRFLKAVNNG